MPTPLVHLGSRLCVAECDRVAINIWRGVPMRDDWRAASEHLAQLHKRYPDGIAALVVFPLPEYVALRGGELDRETMTAVAKQFIAWGRACATVIEGSGFIAASLRSLVAGLTLVTRPPFPSRIFANVPEAVAWLGTVTRSGPAQPGFGRELRIAVDNARAAVDAQHLAAAQAR